MPAVFPSLQRVSPHRTCSDYQREADGSQRSRTHGLTPSVKARTASVQQLVPWLLFMVVLLSPFDPSCIRPSSIQTSVAFFVVRTSLSQVSPSRLRHFRCKSSLGTPPVPEHDVEVKEAVNLLTRFMAFVVTAGENTKNVASTRIRTSNIRWRPQKNSSHIPEHIADIPPSIPQAEDEITRMFLNFRGSQKRRFDMPESAMAVRYLSLATDKYSVLDSDLVTRTGPNKFRFQLYLGDLIGLHASFVADLKVENTPQLGKLSFVGESVRLVALSPPSESSRMNNHRTPTSIADVQRYSANEEAEQSRSLADWAASDNAVSASSAFPKTKRLIPPPPIIASSDIYQRALRGENFSSPFNISFTMQMTWNPSGANLSSETSSKGGIYGLKLPLKIRPSLADSAASLLAMDPEPASTGSLPVMVRVEAHTTARIPAPRRITWFLPQPAVNSACNVLLRAAMKPATAYFVKLLLADYTKRKADGTLDTTVDIRGVEKH